MNDNETLAWEPGLYQAFGPARLRPARDLIAAIPALSARRIVDLGCGTGAVTRLLAERWADAQIEAIDASPEMLAAAADDGPADRIAWRRQDIADWRPPAPVDLVFSNAALHWLDDHQQLFARLVGCLAPGGVLAVQMPDNYDEPSHQCLCAVAGQPRWASRLGTIYRRRPVLAPQDYYDCLAPVAVNVDIWQTRYHHRLEGADAIIRWLSATAMRPFLEPLDAEERAAFTDACRAPLARAYPPRADGTILFAMTRLFIIARARGRA